MASGRDMTTIDVPVVLRDLLALQRLQERQPYYEIVEEALSFWLEAGGWGPGWFPLVDVPRPVRRG